LSHYKIESLKYIQTHKYKNIYSIIILINYIKKFDYLFFFKKEADNQLIRLNRHGAEAARGAHNSEDTGSKPVAGILVSIRLAAW
jgi:hypothetical protein